MRTWLLPLILLATGCSGDNSPPVGDGSREGLRFGDGFRFDHRVVDYPRLEPPPPGEFGFGGCIQPGNHFQLRYAVQQFDIDSTDVKLEKGAQGLIGVSGSAGGYRFWFGREGDPDAAAYSEPRMYQATQAPYHVMLQRWPQDSGASCAGNRECQTFYGLNGHLKLEYLNAPTQASFNISLIVTDKGCWVEQPSGPPVTSGCAVIGGNFYGCFKVN